MGKSNQIKMPSINEVQRLFLSQVAPEERNVVCDREWLDAETDVETKKCNEMYAMLILAYIELILPIFTIGGSFLFKNDAKHIWGSNLPGLGCITAGSIYLALYYGKNLTMTADTHMMFKAHVGIAIAMCIIGVLLIIQVTLSFIGVLLCGECCSGERAIGLFAFIFTLIGLLIVFAIPIGTMVVGWTYAFGDCSDDDSFDYVMRALAVCSGKHVPEVL